MNLLAWYLLELDSSGKFRAVISWVKLLNTYIEIEGHRLIKSFDFENCSDCGPEYLCLLHGKMEFRKATEDDIDTVMSLVNRAYHVTETGSTGVAFKAAPRYGH